MEILNIKCESFAFYIYGDFNMKKNILILMVLPIIFLLFQCKKESINKTITVSILPQKYFVQRIVEDKFDINVMVGPGQNPATYEPLPAQMSDLKKSILYFRIGVPFEDSWINKIKNNNPELTIIDTREGIKLREFDSFEEDHDVKHENEDSNDEHHHEGKDPHIWLSPALVKIQAENIYKAIVKIDPSNKKVYQKNFDAFMKDLDQLSMEIKKSFADVKSKEFMVFHPAWGYFADEFGLKQLPIEIEGKEPSPKQLLLTINKAKKDNIKVIFVQKQFSQKAAKAIAEEISGVVIPIDPLSNDYINNLKNVSETILKNIK